MELKPGNKRGVALILSILVTSIIVALTLQFNRSSRVEIYEAANLADHVRLLYVAKSGFYKGEALLLDHHNNYDSLTQDWSDTANISKESEDLFDGSSYQLSIQDESGKIPLSILVGPKGINPENENILIRLLSLPEFGLPDEQIVQILKSVQDSFSPGQMVGSESLAGLNLFQNGRLDTLDQILLIKGVTPELYYGTDSRPGLIDCLSLYGEGKININTAPKIVLRALSDDMSPEVVDRLDDYRRTKGLDLSDPTWYQRIPGAENVHLNAQWITTQSNVFKINCTSRIGDMTETVQGVVKRVAGANEINLLSWKGE